MREGGSGVAAGRLVGCEILHRLRDAGWAGISQRLVDLMLVVEKIRHCRAEYRQEQRSVKVWYTQISVANKIRRYRTG